MIDAYTFNLANGKKQTFLLSLGSFPSSPATVIPVRHNLSNHPKSHDYFFLDVLATDNLRNYSANEFQKEYSNADVFWYAEKATLEEACELRNEMQEQFIFQMSSPTGSCDRITRIGLFTAAP